MSEVVASAQWMIKQVQIEAEKQGMPLTPEELDLLAATVWSLSDDQRPAMFALNNKVVTFARAAMVRSKQAGAMTTKVRRGLVIPSDWLRHYSITFNAESPMAISAFMQNAMMENPMAGERKPWKSR